MSASSDERLSRTIEGAFRLTLTESAGSDECVFLADLATELRSEGVSPPFAITADNLERVLFARLSTPQNAFPEGAWRRDPEAAPFAWLVRSYLRCFHASRKSASSKDLQEKQAALLAAANELCVSYCGLLLNPAMDGMFPQPEAAAARGPSQLFDEITGADGLPPGFLDAFARRFESEGLPEMLDPSLTQLPSLINGVSPLGEVHKPLTLLCQLAACKPVAARLAAHPKWKPPTTTTTNAFPGMAGMAASSSSSSSSSAINGRAFEDESLLGPFFGCSALPDPALLQRQPSVAEQCFRCVLYTGPHTTASAS